MANPNNTNGWDNLSQPIVDPFAYLMMDISGRTGNHTRPNGQTRTPSSCSIIILVQPVHRFQLLAVIPKGQGWKKINYVFYLYFYNTLLPFLLEDYLSETNLTLEQ